MVYQTFWLRAVAVIIDSLLLWPLAILESNNAGKSPGVISILILVLQHSYYIIGHAQYGQTLGKRLMGLKVVRTHELLPLQWKHAIWRQMLWILLSVVYSFIDLETAQTWVIIPALVIFSADTLIAAIHPRRRSLRDFIAKTVVVRTSI
jgi:uncharacterized RDD family membrane protein YckC